ncbi:methyltransferase domain-containing protein [Geodermatophilus normandii]|uniref:Class I SAM-dependent methyltransferase n=1 Tax=Geodermatophilus normandii TaxID=1137989 RepID=A0A6P0GFA0_9ACTN|nr:class I SAM-dependent methyltransferase [Geodermatophilus normandii]
MKTPAALRKTAPFRVARRLYTRVRFGDLDRFTPLSSWGWKRGTPVDRWYIERFLTGHADLVHGSALEVKSDLYASRLGARSVDVLDIDADNALATVVGDVCDPDVLPQSAYDVAVITQTLQLVDDPVTAVRHLAAALRPGGALLVTVPTMSRLVDDSDRWRWTPRGLEHLLRAAAPPDATVEVAGLGNGLTARAFLFGLSAEEVGEASMRHTDPHYPLVAGGVLRVPA